MFLFAIVHSVTADGRIKQAFSQTFGERIYYGWYRLLYNVLSVLMLMPIVVSLLRLDGIIWQTTGGIAWGLRAIQGIGLVGAIVALLQIDWARFAGLKQVIAWSRGDPLPLPTEPLQIKGMYRYVRHPLYFFSLLVLWFTPTMTTGGVLFAITATLYFVIGSRIEEMRMVNAFGEEYERYQETVAWLIPFAKFTENS